MQPQTASSATVSARDLELHRPVLRAHAYRMTASAADAEDAVQDALVRAWRAREDYRGDGPLRGWLLRIVTRTSLDLLARRRARWRPTELGAVGTTEDELRLRDAETWVEPIAEAEVMDPAATPEEALAARHSLRLAFVTALQRLPARQRAALLLADVCEWRAPAIAEALETTPAAVNSALQRARATLAAAPQGTPADALVPEHAGLLRAYVDAFERYDVEALLSVMREDVTLCMPPYELWLRGQADVGAWFLGRGGGCRGSRLVPARANGGQAYGQYRRAAAGGHAPWSLVLLEVEGGRVASMIHFLDTATVFPRMGLPMALPAE